MLEAVRAFTPNWFAVTMGTGILALVLPKFPLPVPGLVAVGEGLWWFDIGLFALCLALSAARAALYPRETLATLHHPVQSMFLGAIPMGFATLINGLIAFGLPRWGEAAAGLARDAWYADAVLAVACGVLVPYLMFTRQDHALERMSAVWLLPVVASEVTAASAGLIAPHLNPADALVLVYGGYTLWALSVPLALALLSVLVLRLAQHKLPHRDLGASMWLPLGPLGTGALGLVLLGQAAPRVLELSGLGSLGVVFTGFGLVGGLLLWGYGLWWLMLAVLTTRRFALEGLPFNLGWWGFTFPLGVFASSTFALAGMTHLAALTVFGGALVVVLAGFWGLVAARTLHGVWHGHVFHPPIPAPSGKAELPSRQGWTGAD